MTGIKEIDLLQMQRESRDGGRGRRGQEGNINTKRIKCMHLPLKINMITLHCKQTGRKLNQKQRKR